MDGCTPELPARSALMDVIKDVLRIKI